MSNNKIKIGLQVEKISKNQIRLMDTTNNVCFMLLNSKKDQFAFEYFDQKIKDQKTLIVTFTCNNNIHTYGENSGIKPRPPYKIHSSIEDARLYLKTVRKVEDPKIINK